MAVAFRQGKLVLPSSGRSLDESRTAQDLEAELFHFEPTALRSGKLQYGAVNGYYDDLVMVLCLAYSTASHAPREPMVEFLDDPRDKESTIPYPIRRATFLLRDVALQPVPCHFAKETDLRSVPLRKVLCVL